MSVNIHPEGVTFSLFAKHATKVTLCLRTDDKEQTIELDRTGDIWQVQVEGLVLPVEYAFLVEGPQDSPYYYHPNSFVFDPYAKELNTSHIWGSEKEKPFGVVTKPEPFDWQGIVPPRHQTKDLVIYEAHVRGFTQDPSSEVKHPGTFLGIIEKIPYLLDLGINAVELLPICEFDESAYKQTNPETGEQLFNYWGYSTLNFFMPCNRYAVKNSLLEFKTLVRELHRAGIEVILDIVFNHTAESPISFRGIDRATYYMLDDGHDCNYTGCGHTMNLNHPVMRQFVHDCLHYWVDQMHVDGFRFDLASVMNRDVDGALLQPAALVEELTHDPFLANTKLIAEPWDMQAYQLGGFCPESPRWSEWNGRYRDTVRQFIKGDAHSKSAFATCLTGSHDLFGKRSAQSSINFVTAHDGFSLMDLVSYNQKDNFANGEENRDGSEHNTSWNCGHEGKTEEEEILHLRQRQIKNFFLALMVSKGVPMVHMGDEYGHTKGGNNNTWCQDNKLNWFLWDTQSPLYDFVRNLIHFRRNHRLLTSEEYWQEDELIWHNPNWDDPKPFLAFSLIDHQDGADLFIAFNACAESREITLPATKEGQSWHQVVNTAAAHPNDFSMSAPPLTHSSYTLAPYSSIMLGIVV